MANRPPTSPRSGHRRAQGGAGLRHPDREDHRVHTKPFIVLSSSLLNLLDEQEKMYVICHELGTLLGAGLALPLLDWYRKAELSADRAALLAVQDPDVAIRTFMKLAGGSESLIAEMDQAAFLQQIRTYEDRDVSNLDRAYKLLITIFRTHPFPIMRAKHLDSWVSEGGYSKVSGLTASPLQY